MKHLYYILTLLMLVSCGTNADKKNGGMPAEDSSDAPGTSVLGELPAIYAEGYEKAKVLQEQIQTAYKNGGSPDRSLLEDMANLPKEVKAKAQAAGDITGNEIKIEGESPYDFVKIDKAVISRVKFENNGTRIYIRFVPAEGYDFKSMPRGTTVYYLCLTEDNNLIFRNAMYLPSDGITAISMSMLPSAKASPALWGGLAKIRFVSKEDFYGMMNAMR